jgi:hypothetical protein
MMTLFDLLNFQKKKNSLPILLVQRQFGFWNLAVVLGLAWLSLSLGHPKTIFNILLISISGEILVDSLFIWEERRALKLLVVLVEEVRPSSDFHPKTAFNILLPRPPTLSDFLRHATDILAAVAVWRPWTFSF